ncbi:OprO/OprP family phosphate-selective porin [Croceicoccus bisphenolivorans]|uniref:OprO/OprP family phosphate-selective porin n=1 Tax=Croceicoccus bisphenolivorans TaxID=1783232 RepID=UPI000836640A|nr:porin [Croceicoccus bisphenolivorans]
MRISQFSEIGVSAIAVIASAGLASPAFAQDADAAAVQAELQQMRAQMQAMASRIDTLEAQLETANAKADAAAETSSTALATAEAAKSETKISWKGAPEIETKSGWSFKPRGRLQYDAGVISAPDMEKDIDDGFGNEARRVRLGVQGDMPGGFSYKFEADFAKSEIEIADAFIGYEDGGLKLAIGHQNNFQSLEELTSSLNISFMERAAFTDAFGFERRVGASAAYKAGDLLVQGGVFTANIHETGENKQWGADGRVVFAPKTGNTQLHFGGSLHYTDLDGDVSSVSYSQRPFVHFTSTKFIKASVAGASEETGYGLEAAAIRGPLHFSGEAHWQSVSRPGLADPTFFGASAEVGYFLTRGDTRGYKNGIFDRVKPANPVDKGGMGALQVNLRYDRLDLNDAGIVGGTQDGYALSLIWMPTNYTRFMVNYGRMEYSDAVIATAGDATSYGVDAFGARAQIDF